jgi:predicted small metal-binding protein
MRATFDFASKLPLDTFGFNRLCVYRGTPLWQEYLHRGLVNDATDWYKYFKCSEIDPTCLPGEKINEVRQEGLKRLFLYKLTRYPLQTYRLLRRFLRYMPVRDVVYLIMKPFLGKQRGATKAEVLTRAVEHAEMKDAAAELTQLTEEKLQNVLKASRAERLRIQRDADGSRELPMIPAR